MKDWDLRSKVKGKVEDWHSEQMLKFFAWELRVVLRQLWNEIDIRKKGLRKFFSMLQDGHWKILIIKKKKKRTKSKTKKL